MGKIYLELDLMMAKNHISLNELAEKVGITNYIFTDFFSHSHATRGAVLFHICSCYLTFTLMVFSTPLSAKQ